MENKKSLLLELDIDDGEYRFPSTISTAIIDANSEVKELEEKIEDTQQKVARATLLFLLTVGVISPLYILVR